LVNNNAHLLISPHEEFLTDHGLDKAFFGTSFAHIFWNPPPAGRIDNAAIKNPEGWFQRLQRDPDVLAYSPQLTLSVIFSSGKSISPGTLIGCAPLAQAKVTTIGDYVVEGQFTDLASGGRRLILGMELKRKLGVHIGQSVLVSLGRHAPSPFRIAGFYSSGNKLSDSMAYGSISDIQTVNQTPNQVNQIAVKTRDFAKASLIAKLWRETSTDKIESWDVISGNILEVFKIQDAVRFLSVGSIMVVAGFGIYNVLNMTVLQKRRDVAILRSLGYSTWDILILFLTQGLILGVLGIALGLTFGFFLVSF
jgi:lipoprotein-releasing system permease protein